MKQIILTMKENSSGHKELDVVSEIMECSGEEIFLFIHAMQTEAFNLLNEFTTKENCPVQMQMVASAQKGAKYMLECLLKQASIIFKDVHFKAQELN